MPGKSCATMEGEQPSSAQTKGQPQNEPPPLEVNPAPLLGEPVSLAKTCAEGRSVYQLQQNYQREIVRSPGEQFILENRQPQDGCQVVEMLSYGTLFLEENKRTGEIQYLAGTPPRATMAEARIAQYYWPAFYRCLRFHQMLENESGDPITHPMPACWNDPDTTGTLSNFVNTPFVDDHVRQQHRMRQEAEPVVKVEPPDSPIQDAEMCDVSLPGQPSDNKIKSGESDSSSSGDESDSTSSSDDIDSSASSKRKVARYNIRHPTPTTTAASDCRANLVNTCSTEAKQSSTNRTVASTGVSSTVQSLPTQSTSKKSKLTATHVTVAWNGIIPQTAQFHTKYTSTEAKQTSTPRTVASTSDLPLAPQIPMQSMSTFHPLLYISAAYPEQRVFLQPWSSAPSTYAGTSGAHPFPHTPASTLQQEAAAPARKVKFSKPTAQPAMDQAKHQRSEVTRFEKGKIGFIQKRVAIPKKAAAPVRKVKFSKPTADTAMDQDEQQMLAMAMLKKRRRQIANQKLKERRKKKRIAEKAAGQGKICAPQAPAGGVQHQVLHHPSAQRDLGPHPQARGSHPPVPTGVRQKQAPKPPKLKK